MRVGILGAGSVAHTMAKTLKMMSAAGRPVELYAVAARDADRARKLAQQDGAAKSYGDYEALLTDPDVDLVYIATWHVTHAELIKKCMDYGKPVLCEKSLTVNAREAAEVITASQQSGVFMADGLWSRYMPAYGEIRRLLNDGAIGEPLITKAVLCTHGYNKPYLLLPEAAGGALLSVGVYPLSFASFVMGNDVTEVITEAKMSASQLDLASDTVLRYRCGAEAHFRISTDREPEKYESWGMICGSEGMLVVDSVNCPQRVMLYRGANRREPVHDARFPILYTGVEYELEACLRDIPLGRIEPEEMPHSESLTIMRQMDALRAQWGMRYPFE